MIPALRRLCLALAVSLGGFASSVFADSAPPVPKPFAYVGSISIQPSQDPKILADWYAKLGFETKLMQGGYYCQVDTVSGPFFFGIHPKKKSAPPKSSGSMSVVFAVENIAARLAAVKARGLVPDSTEQDAMGLFAHFHDPDGNEITLWGK